MINIYQTKRIQGTETQPNELFDDNAEASAVTNGEDIRNWCWRDCHARFLIFNCCDETRKLALVNSKTSHEIWTILETQFLQRAADNKHLLQRDFSNLRPKEGEDIMIHVTALESMAVELNDLGVNVTKHDLITKIICSLLSILVLGQSTRQ